MARAVVKDGIDKFSVAYLDEAAMDIRLLLDHRNDLVGERTRSVNALDRHDDAQRRDRHPQLRDRQDPRRGGLDGRIAR
ncbi:MAG: hypothetical protein ACRDM7_03770 [Thermoleophilaceae bacterium]